MEKELFDKLSELSKQLKCLVTIEGSVREQIGQQELHLAEDVRVLGGLEELISMTDEMMKAVGDLKLQLHKDRKSVV